MKFKDTLTKIMPTRSQAKNTDVFFDFDKMQTESVPFKLNGKVHQLKPVTVGEFYALANGLAKLKMFAESDDVGNKDESAIRLHEVFSSVCDTITVEDLKATQPHVLGLLYRLLMDHAGGRLNLDEWATDGVEKKKTMNN